MQELRSHLGRKYTPPDLNNRFAVVNRATEIRQAATASIATIYLCIRCLLAYKSRARFELTQLFSSLAMKEIQLQIGPDRALNIKYHSMNKSLSGAAHSSEGITTRPGLGVFTNGCPHFRRPYVFSKRGPTNIPKHFRDAISFHKARGCSGVRATPGV